MIGCVTLGSHDLPRAAACCDALLAEIGAKRPMEFEAGIAWGVAMDEAMDKAMDKASLGIMKPHDKQPATVGNGVMAAIVVDSRDKVDRLYMKAMALGGQDEGPAGPPR